MKRRQGMGQRMLKNFPLLVKDVQLKIQEQNKYTGTCACARAHTHTHTHKHIPKNTIIKLLKIKDKEKIKRSQMKKRHITFKGIGNKTKQKE